MKAGSVGEGELEHEIEQLEQSRAAKSQQPKLVTKQATFKCEELHILGMEVQDLDDMGIAAPSWFICAQVWSG